MDRISDKELYDRAQIFKQNQDYNNYIIYITKAANNGYRDAIDNIYKCDTYKKQDYSVTIKFYEATVEYSYSAHFLGYMYYNGLYVKQNISKSLELFELANKKGNGHSARNLALLYEQGQFEIKNNCKALELYEFSINKGVYESLMNLANMYKHGYGTKQNYVKAKELYELAIDKGYIDALNQLGFMYEFGHGVIINYDHAIELYEKAIEGGDLSMVIRLDNLYKKNFPLNCNKIIKLHTVSFIKGNTYSINSLSQLLRTGTCETEKMLM